MSIINWNSYIKSALSTRYINNLFGDPDLFLNHLVRTDDKSQAKSIIRC